MGVEVTPPHPPDPLKGRITVLKMRNEGGKVEFHNQQTSVEEAEQLGVTQLQQNPSALDTGVRRFFSTKVNPKKKKNTHNQHNCGCNVND